MSMDHLEASLREIVRDELGYLLINLGQALVEGSGTDEAAADATAPARDVYPEDRELRYCAGCGSETDRPCGNEDCEWASGKPVQGFTPDPEPQDDDDLVGELEDRPLAPELSSQEILDARLADATEAGLEQ